MYICRSLQKGARLHTGKNVRLPSTEPHADRRPTYNGVRLGSPRGETRLTKHPLHCEEISQQ
jgi:hypothetical protein